MDPVQNKSNTIVLIHGLFVNNTSWNEWKTYFEAKGYKVHAPSLPGHEGNPAELRKNIHPNLTNTGFKDAVDHLSAYIDQLSEKPIIIGHSLGGLVVQKLIEAGKAVAGVSIDGAPPKNVMPPLSTLSIIWPVVNFFKSNSNAYLGTRDWYHRAFFNNYSKTESDQLYEQWAVPESRKLAKESALGSFARVDLKKQHPPLLFIGGEKDTIFSAAFTQKIVKEYKDNSNSRADYKMFEGRSHFICGEKKWEEVAAYVHQWIVGL